MPPCPRAALVVALVGISNHDNIGAIFRNAAAFGADAVLLDETCCDPLYRKAIRVSVGAALKVPFANAGTPCTGWPSSWTRTASASSRCRLAARRYPRGRPARSGWRSISAPKATACPPVCWRGLTTVRIPIAPGFDSLNVAAASAIALHRDQEQRAE